MKLHEFFFDSIKCYIILGSLFYRLEYHFIEAIFPLPSMFYNVTGLAILYCSNSQENQQNSCGNICQCSIPSAGLDRIEQTCTLFVIETHRFALRGRPHYGITLGKLCSGAHTMYNSVFILSRIFNFQILILTDNFELERLVKVQLTVYLVCGNMFSKTAHYRKPGDNKPILICTHGSQLLLLKHLLPHRQLHVHN